MQRAIRKNAAKLLAASMVLSGIAVPGEVVKAETLPIEVLAVETKGADTTAAEPAATVVDLTDAPVFTFSDTAITSSAEVDGVEIEDTAIEIGKAGTYVFTGTCANGNISVKKETEDVIIVLNGLKLTSTTTAPICCKKESKVEIYAVEGIENTLADAEANADDENKNAEKAVIKTKDGSELTLSGAGTLTINGVSKNGIKGSAEADIIVKDQNLVITALDNALASDNSVTIESGKVIITSEEGDGIKASPDEEDTESKGKIHLNGGEVIIRKANDGIQATDAIAIKKGTYQITSADNAIKSDMKVQVDGGTFVLNAGGDGIKASNASGDGEKDADSATETTTTGDVIINAGEFTIDAVGDAIQAELALTLADGTYNIKTNGGASTKLADDADSCKALKAGTELTVNGGKYTIDSADDAVHSNEYVTINAGTFDITTGDDGMHADTTLTVGQETGEIQPAVKVSKSYEGLEGGTVYVFGGDVDVTSSDDGVNAAGGSSNGTDPGNHGPGGGDKFNPGGSRPGKRSSTEMDTGAVATKGAGGSMGAGGDYTIYMEGGNIKVHAGGDGLDSNGALNLDGGNIHVYGSMTNGGNSPLDADGGINMNGGTVFAAGLSSMNEKMTLTQPTLFETKTSYDAGTIINVVDGNEKVLFSEELEIRCNYVFYSSPEMTEDEEYSIVTGKLVEDEADEDDPYAPKDDGEDDPYEPDGDGENNPYEPDDEDGNKEDNTEDDNTGDESNTTENGNEENNDDDDKDDDAENDDSENGDAENDDNENGDAENDDNENGDKENAGNEDGDEDEGNAGDDNNNGESAGDDNNNGESTGGNNTTGNESAGNNTTSGNATGADTGAGASGNATGADTGAVPSGNATGTAAGTVANPVAAGTKLTDSANNATYVVTDAQNATVAYAGTNNKNATKITIPKTVTIGEVTYKVTSIQAKAFRNNKKLTQVTIGSNVKKIGKRAFEGCKKLKNIVIDTTSLKKGAVGAKAFKGTPKNVTVKVPKSVYKSYKKWLTSKGISKKAKIKK